MDITNGLSMAPVDMQFAEVASGFITEEAPKQLAQSGTDSVALPSGPTNLNGLA